MRISLIIVADAAVMRVKFVHLETELIGLRMNWNRSLDFSSVYCEVVIKRQISEF